MRNGNRRRARIGHDDCCDKTGAVIAGELGCAPPRPLQEVTNRLRLRWLYAKVSDRPTRQITNAYVWPSDSDMAFDKITAMGHDGRVTERVRMLVESWQQSNVGWPGKATVTSHQLNLIQLNWTELTWPELQDTGISKNF